jgi:thiol-disulfide isomerase/thioredoxin
MIRRLLLCLLITLAAAGRVALAAELKAVTPRPAPALRLIGLDGKTHDLKDYRGKVVLVNFWANWCPPCRAEMPSMQRLYTMLKDRPFVILAVDMAEPEKDVRDFLRELRDVPLTFPILLDARGEAMKAWKVHVFPTSFVVDAEGTIRYAVAGSLEWDEADPSGKIESLLPARVPSDGQPGFQHELPHQPQ